MECWSMIFFFAPAGGCARQRQMVISTVNSNLARWWRNMRRQLILGILSYLAMTSFVLAQTATGVIRGTVQDPTGAVLIDVHVMLVDQARNQSWEQTTNEEGFFEFRALPFGNYALEVEHPGFRKQVIKN